MGVDVPELDLILPILLQNPDVLNRLPPEQQAEAVALMEALVVGDDGWPEVYVNRDTKKIYRPHTPAEAAFVYMDEPRYGLLRGGEGSGKSTAGIIKDLNRVRRSMPGFLASPDLPHFQRSLWKEFQRWCPWDLVVPSHRVRAAVEWVPFKPFDIVFQNDAYVHCVGVKNARSLEGPNINWAHFDEARHYPDRSAIVTIDGRIRIPGPNGEPPQMWYTTTPEMNWLFDYFGPVQCTCRDCGKPHKGERGIEVQAGIELKCPACGSVDLEIEDPLFSFKMDSRVVRLTSRMNQPNLMAGYAEKRAQTIISQVERDVLLEGLWGAVEEGQPFLPSILWWDQCKEDLPPLGPYEPIVVAVDAATGREFAVSDCFAVMGLSRHPEASRMDDCVAVRFAKTWQVGPGQRIDFLGTPENPGPERFLLNVCGYDLDGEERIVDGPSMGYDVLEIAYDPRQMHDLASRFQRAQVANMREFTQGVLRDAADRQFLNLIQQRRIAHDGNSELRQHLLNADRKVDTRSKSLRIVKRHEAGRIDLAVVASMGSYEVLRLNL